MAFDPSSFYDRYWTARDRCRTEARSRERAAATLDLLQLGGVPGGRLLDIGCGPGWTLEIFQAAGYTALGVDTAGVAIAEARSRGLDARKLDLEREDLRSLLVAGEKWDAAIALEVLEHLLDPCALLGRVRESLSPGGVLVASLPNELALPARLRILTGRLPFGGHNDPHLRHFDRRQAFALFHAAGFEVKRVRPLSVVPPRWRRLRASTGHLVRLLPGAFSLANVFLCTPRGAQPPEERRP